MLLHAPPLHLFSFLGTILCRADYAAANANMPFASSMEKTATLASRALETHANMAMLNSPPHRILRSLAPVSQRGRGNDVRPLLHAINEQSVLEQALLARLRCRDLYSPKLAVPIRQVLDAYVLVVDLAVCAEGQVEHGQWTRAELVHGSADGPL